MLQQAGVRIAHVLVHEEELVGDVVEVGGGLEGDGELGAEGFGHVGAVEPHLVGVDLLVPVAAAGGARLKGELIVEELGGAGVLGVLGDAVEEEDGAAHLDVVEGVGLGLVADDCAVGGDAWIDGGLDEVEDCGVGGVVPLGCHAVQTDSVFVAPGAGGGGGGRALLEDGRGHHLGGGGQGGGRRGGLWRCGLRRGHLRECDGGEAEDECCGEQIRQAHDRSPMNRIPRRRSLVLEGEGDQLGEGRSMESMTRTSMGSLARTSLRPRLS